MLSFLQCPGSCVRRDPPSGLVLSEPGQVGYMSGPSALPLQVGCQGIPAQKTLVVAGKNKILSPKQKYRTLHTRNLLADCFFHHKNLVKPISEASRVCIALSPDRTTKHRAKGHISRKKKRRCSNCTLQYSQTGYRYAELTGLYPK